MILEVTVHMSATVPDDTLGEVSRAQLAELARETVEARFLERLKLMFVGWPTRVDITAAVDGQTFQKKST